MAVPLDHAGNKTRNMGTNRIRNACWRYL